MAHRTAKGRHPSGSWTFLYQAEVQTLPSPHWALTLLTLKVWVTFRIYLPALEERLILPGDLGLLVNLDSVVGQVRVCPGRLHRAHVCPAPL